jgi:hypothetical protein
MAAFKPFSQDRRERIQITVELPLMYKSGRHAEPSEVQFPPADNEISIHPSRTRSA